MDLAFLRNMQRAGSLGALDGAATALAHQLPRAVDSASSLTTVPATAVGQVRASPHGQHCGCLVHQTLVIRLLRLVTAAVSVHQLGGIQSHRMSQLARHLLLCSHTQFKSLRAVPLPGKLKRVADALSRQLTSPGE